jgi:hypothetical protein
MPRLSASGEQGRYAASGFEPLGESKFQLFVRVAKGVGEIAALKQDFWG